MMRTHPVWIAAVGICALVLAGRAPAQDVVIDEDFEAGVISGNLVGTSIIAPDDGRSMHLSLTQGVNNQAGFAWFDESFNLRDNRVEIEFDLWIRSGTSDIPADGLSVIFQFGNDTSAQGGLGGNLGTGNFPTDYVSVAFDIWDNAEGGPDVDPETPCDATRGGTASCHVEVNQNTNPITDPSVQTNIGLGAPSIDFIGVGDTFEPIHTRIVFDNGRIEVYLQTNSTLAPDFNTEQRVINAVLNDFPAVADAIIGFAASTGAANAHHEIDNLVVSTSAPTPQVRVDERLGNGTRGAINTGGAIEVTGTVNGETYTFVPDALFGSLKEIRTDVTPNQNIFRGYGHTVVGNVATFVEPIQGGGDIAQIYQSERWNNGPVAYSFLVDPGRYEVNLHFAENVAGFMTPEGQSTRIVSATINDEPVLSYWNAGGEAGAAHTAVIKTFQVDAGEKLDVIIHDHGLLSNPPENAQINGISYRRIGPATGAPASGDITDLAPAQLPSFSEETIVDADFDDEGIGVEPEGWVLLTNSYLAHVADVSNAYQLPINPRLRLTDNAGNLTSAIVVDEVVDLSSHGFRAEFDVHLTRDLLNGNPPADGLTFFFLPTDRTSAELTAGNLGGGLGYEAMGTVGFAVEFDTWNGPANDPNGFNTHNAGHVGLIINGTVTQHIQTNVSFDPELSPTGEKGWPLTLVSDPTDSDNGQFVTNTFVLESEELAGLHAEVELNNGRLRVWISTVNQDEELGYVMPRALAIDTLLDWGSLGWRAEGYFGFSAGTGGAVTWHEIDNVRITTTVNEPVVVRRTVTPGRFSGAADVQDVALDISVVSGSGPHGVTLREVLPAGFSARSISNGGTLAGGQITWNLQNVSADMQVSYELVPADDLKANAELSGSFQLAGSTATYTVPSTTLNYAPAPFGRGDETILVEDDYDGLTGCPVGWTCNTNNGLVFRPQIVPEGRFRLTNNNGNLATSAFHNEVVDLTENSFTAEFDFYISSNAAQPADGFTFAVIDASLHNTTALGDGGGAIGISGLNGFAVEFDTWDNDGNNGVPTDGPGYNTVGYGHVAVIQNGVVTPHVQSHLDIDPTLIPVAAGGQGWPPFVDLLGTGFLLHARIEYNNGNLEVYLSAEDDGTGFEFPETLVIDTVITFPSSDPTMEPVLQSAYLGFTAGTGGAWQTNDIDNLAITLYERTEVTGGFVRGDSDGGGGLNLTDAIVILNFLFVGNVVIPCLDAADADDSGQVNLTDPIFLLNYLFTGTGNAPPPPHPNCGPDPTPDTVDCAQSHPACL